MSGLDEIRETSKNFEYENRIQCEIDIRYLFTLIDTMKTALEFYAEGRHFKPTGLKIVKEMHAEDHPGETARKALEVLEKGETKNV
jgi:hypothetical protein